MRSKVFASNETNRTGAGRAHTHTQPPIGIILYELIVLDNVIVCNLMDASAGHWTCP